MIYRSSFFQYAVGVLVATLILWDLMATSAMGGGGHHMSGGLTIGGPGKFKGKAADSLLIHSSETTRTLCVTLAGKKGMTSATFAPIAFSLEVTKTEEKSVCRDSVDEITLTCVGGDCEGRWRVDTVGADGTNGADGTDGADGSAGQTGPPGPVGILTISSDCGEVIRVGDHVQIQCDPATTQATTIVIRSVDLERKNLPVDDGLVIAECLESETLLAGGLTCTVDAFNISTGNKPIVIITPKPPNRVTCYLDLNINDFDPDFNSCKCTAICGPST